MDDRPVWGISAVTEVCAVGDIRTVASTVGDAADVGEEVAGGCVGVN